VPAPELMVMKMVAVNFLDVVPRKQHHTEQCPNNYRWRNLRFETDI
jgi:hypothetical protein